MKKYYLGQREQILKAKRAFIQRINNPKDGMSALKFNIWLDIPNNTELVKLWPCDVYRDGKELTDNAIKKELLRYQVLTKNEKLPRYHFSLSGCGYSKTGELEYMLKDINPDIVVQVLYY